MRAKKQPRNMPPKSLCLQDEGPLFAGVLEEAKRRGLGDLSLSQIARRALTEWCKGEKSE